MYLCMGLYFYDFVLLCCYAFMEMCSYRNRPSITINTQAIILFYLLTYLLIYLLRCGGLQIPFTTVAIFATVNEAK